MINLGPLITVKDFNFGWLYARTKRAWNFLPDWVSSGYPVINGVTTIDFVSVKISGGGVVVDLPPVVTATLDLSGYSEYPPRAALCYVDVAGGTHQITDRWNIDRGLDVFETINVCFSNPNDYPSLPKVLVLGSVVIDPMPTVISNLEAFGQRVELWRVHSSLATLLWRSAPVAEISLRSMEEEGFINSSGRVLNFDKQGGFPVLGRNSLGKYYEIDRYIPSNHI